MKVFKLLTALVIILFLVGNVWADDDIDMSAASNAVTCLTQFYSVMAELPNINAGKTARLDYKKKLTYIMDNREKIIKDVSRSKAGYDIVKTDQIIQCMCQKSATSFGNTNSSLKATGEIYYDEAAKHKYIKIDNETYAEYTRKGDFFKNVSSSQPHLVKSQYIHSIDEDNFFLYVKKQGSKKNQYLALPCISHHPTGWGLKKAFVSLE